jgi:hypothetical protein
VFIRSCGYEDERKRLSGAAGKDSWKTLDQKREFVAVKHCRLKR